MDLREEKVEKLRAKYMDLSTYESLDIILKMEKNEILEKAFCVTSTTTPYLEDLVLAINDK